MSALQDLSISHLSGERGVTQKIKQAMYDAAKQFVYIGFLLREVRDYGYYEEGGYANVYQYAEFELGLKRTSTKNFIAIAEQFGTRKDSYHGKLIETQTMSLQPAYKDFNYSQLVELLGMSEPQRAKATPDMTIKQLREIKKEPVYCTINEDTGKLERIDQSAASGQTSDQSDQKLMATVVNNFWQDIDPEIIKAIVKAAGITWNPKSCYNIKLEKHNG